MMHIYHALINALSARMIHINLNMINTHVEQNNLHKVFFLNQKIPVSTPTLMPPPHPPNHINRSCLKFLKKIKKITEPPW